MSIRKNIDTLNLSLSEGIPRKSTGMTYGNSLTVALTQ